MSGKNLKAFCWGPGLLQLGEVVPEGALELASGPEEIVREIVTAECRHGQGDAWQIPGLPAAGPVAFDIAMNLSIRIRRRISSCLASMGGRHETASRH
jgi:hypothetical protein